VLKLYIRGGTYGKRSQERRFRTNIKFIFVLIWRIYSRIIGISVQHMEAGKRKPWIFIETQDTAVQIRKNLFSGWIYEKN